MSSRVPCHLPSGSVLPPEGWRGNWEVGVVIDCSFFPLLSGRSKGKQTDCVLVLAADEGPAEAGWGWLWMEGTVIAQAVRTEESSPGPVAPLP